MYLIVKGKIMNFCMICEVMISNDDMVCSRKRCQEALDKSFQEEFLCPECGREKNECGLCTTCKNNPDTVLKYKRNITSAIN